MKVRVRAFRLVTGAFAAIIGGLLSAISLTTPTLAGTTIQILAHPSGAAVTLLPSGSWLISGGFRDGGVSGAVDLVASPNADASTSGPPALQLNIARTGLTTTVLPDGTVMVFGGTAADGTVLANAEIIDPIAGTVQPLATPGLLPRTDHSATLLTDGRVLIAGGMDATGAPIADAQLWNPQINAVDPVTPSLLNPRFDHQSALQGGGEDLLTGGSNGISPGSLSPELFDPTTNLFGLASPDDTGTSVGIPSVSESIPANDTPDVAVNARLAIRFSEPMQIGQLNSETLTLVGPNGAVAGKVVGAEQGMLAFFTPSVDLLPGATYTLFATAITDAAGTPLPLTTVRFTTHAFTTPPSSTSASASSTSSAVNTSSSAPASAATTPTTSKPGIKATQKAATTSTPVEVAKAAPVVPVQDANEDWIPQEQNRHGHWNVLGLSGDPSLDLTSLTVSDLTAPAGQTGLAGHVVKLNGLPIVGVTVAVGSQSTLTDNQGRFLLTGLTAGTQILKIDGTAVFSNGRHYTQHYLQIEVAPNTTTKLSNPVYLPRVDPAQEVTISSPAAQEIVLTNPAIPGLEVHIPKGTVLRNYDGSIVTKVSITPIPIDRPPYPTPVAFYAYFTLQPGGAYVDGPPSNAIRVIYPNYLGYAPGSRMNFYNYDPKNNGWGVYGQGIVDPAGTQVIPDPSVSFRQLMSFGIGVSAASNAPASGPPPGGCTTAGDPVDCFTGLFLNTETDMTVQDVLPISVTRTYRQNDSVSRAFGIGNTLSYGMYLYRPVNDTDIYVILPDGGRVHFAQQTSTTWMNLDSPSSFYGSVLSEQTSPEQWNLVMPDHSSMVFYRDPPNQLETITDRNGNTIQINSGGSGGGNVTEIISPSGRTIQLGYDSSNRITSATDNLGNTVNYFYNAPNCAGCLWYLIDQKGNKETYSYDTSGRLYSTTDKRSNVVVTLNYNANNQVSTETLADGTSWQFSYGTSSSGTAQTTITDPNGHITQDTFNASGYLTQQVLAMGLPEQQTYQFGRGASELVSSILDPLGRTTTLSYDAYADVTNLVRLSGTSQAIGYVLTYDATFHQLTKYTDPNGHNTTFTYNSAGTLSGITNALGNTWTITPSANGLPTAVTDPLSHAVQFGYQGNDLTSVTDALGRKTTIFTDDAGRPENITDPLGNITRYAFDARNQLSSITDPTNGVTSLQYDANGNLTSVTDPRAAGAHTFGYDAYNRKNMYTDPAGNSETYQYDDVGNLLYKIDRKGQKTQIAYDGINRPHVITYQDGSTIAINWDAGNRPTTIVDSASGTITQQYDLLDRLTQESGPQGTVVYQYDASGRRTQLSVTGESNSIVYSYDVANRLTSITQGANVVSFAPDSANRPGTVTLPNGILGTYAFDDANELIGLSYSSGSSSVGTLSYTYDLDGRRTSLSGSLAGYVPPMSSTMSYDASNRLTSETGTVLTYDLDGNLTAFGNNSYTWNARNQLTATSGGSATYAYDALGRRVGTTINGTSTAYLYDGLNAVLVGGTQMLDGLALDEIYASTGANGTSSFMPDGDNNTAAIANSSGAITADYTYSPYGDSTGGSATPYQFTGRENDGTTGLYYFRARYYSPQLGRFISQDPIGLLGGSNVYAYALDNPVNLIDPLGLCQDWFAYGTGVADALSFGVGRLLRNLTPYANEINADSSSYKAGAYTGAAVQAVTGGAAAVAANAGVQSTAQSLYVVGQLIVGDASLTGAGELPPVVQALYDAGEATSEEAIESAEKAIQAASTWMRTGVIW